MIRILTILLLCITVVQAQTNRSSLLGRITLTLVTDTTYSDTAKFITYTGGGVTASGWANINNGSNASPHLGVATGTQGVYTLTTNNASAWTAFGGNTSNSVVGENTSDGSGFAFSSTVQRAGVYNYNDTYSGSTSDASFKISGCTVGQLYNVQLLPSCDAGLLGYNSDATAKFIHAGGTTTYTTYMNGTQNVGGTNPSSTGVMVTGNTSKYFSMWGYPDASGFLFIWIGGTDNATDAKRLGFANGIIIRKATITTH